MRHYLTEYKGIKVFNSKGNLIKRLNSKLRLKKEFSSIIGLQDTGIPGIRLKRDDLKTYTLSDSSFNFNLPNNSYYKVTLQQLISGDGFYEESTVYCKSTNTTLNISNRYLDATIALTSSSSLTVTVRNCGLYNIVITKIEQIILTNHSIGERLQNSCKLIEKTNTINLTLSNLDLTDVFGIQYVNSMWFLSSQYSGNWFYYSTDGKNWNKTNIQKPINYIKYANGIFVAGSRGSTTHCGEEEGDSAYSIGLYYSTDGITWTQSNVTSGGVYGEIYYINNLWVVSIDDYIRYSEDGKTWTTARSTYAMAELRYANGIFISTYSRDTSNSYMLYSTDGKTWNSTKLGALAPDQIMYGNGIWIASPYNGNSKYFLRSTDGITWNTYSAPYSNLGYIAYANGIFVGSCNNTNISSGLSYSTDGITWTQSNITTGYNYYGYYPIFANGLWVISLNNGLYYSTDGKTWTQNSNITNSKIHYSNGIWIANGSKGVWYSTDGKTWTQITTIPYHRGYFDNGVLIIGSTEYTNTTGLPGKYGIYYAEPLFIDYKEAEI